MTGVFIYLAACVLSGFCSGSETAFSASSRVRIAAAGRKARTALWFLDDPSRYLVASLVGTNVGTVVASSVGHSWGGGLGGEWEILFAFFTALFLLVFSEIVPKHLALFRSDAATIAAAPVLRLIRGLLYPLIAAATAASRLISGPSEQNRFFESREEIRGLLVESGGRQGRLASSVIALGNTGVGRYARSLESYPSVDTSCARKDAVNRLMESGEDFLLVWEEPGVTLLGAVRASSLVRWTGTGSITSIVTGLPYFSSDFPALKILPQLWRSRAVAGVILDDRGQPALLITPAVILSHLLPEEAVE